MSVSCVGSSLRLAIGSLAGRRRGRSAPPVPAAPVPASSAATPAGRAPSAARQVRWRIAVPVVAAAAGGLFVTSVVTSAGTELRGSRERLPDLVTAKQRSVEAIREDVAAFEDHSQRDYGRRPKTAPAQDDALLALAGLTPLRGPAVTVTLSDAPRESWNLPRPSGIRAPGPNDLVVHQQDVQAVVNALWAGGAEAMTIMDRRVTTLTSVRCVGNTLLVQGDVYSPPFTISAIGDTNHLRAALDAEPGVLLFRRYAEAYHLGYQVEVFEDVVMPAYEGAVELRVAQPGTVGSNPPA